MTNPISGAYLESQDIKATKDALNDDSSKKMGLEAIGAAATAFKDAVIDSAIQSPANAIAQLFDHEHKMPYHWVKPKVEKLGSAEWFGQLAGNAVGNLTLFMSPKLLQGAGNLGKMWAPTSKVIDTLESAARPISRFLSQSAAGKLIAKIENAPVLKDQIGMLGHPVPLLKNHNHSWLPALGLGALYGGILTPVDPKSENFVAERLKNAAVDALTLSAFVGVNNLGRGMRGFTPGGYSKQFLPDERSSHLGHGIMLALGGPIAGLTNVSLRAAVEGRKVDPESRDFKESMLSYSLLGLGLGGWHGGAHAYEAVKYRNIFTPTDLSQLDQIDRLTTARETHKRTKEKSICTLENDAGEQETFHNQRQWKELVDRLDTTIKNEIEASSLSLDAKQDLLNKHTKELSKLIKDPQNIGRTDRYNEHWKELRKNIANDGVWYSTLERFDDIICKQIENSSLAYETKQDLIKLHKMDLFKIMSDPANKGMRRPLETHWENIKRQMEAEVKKQLQAGSQPMQDTITGQALERWNEQNKMLPAVETPVEQLPSQQTPIDQFPIVNQPVIQTPTKTTNTTAAGETRRLAKQQGADAGSMSQSSLGRKAKEGAQRASKSANMNPYHPSNTGNMAETLCTEGLGGKGKTKLNTSSFVKQGHTRELLIRQQMAGATNTESGASGIGLPSEVNNRTKPKKWLSPNE